MEQITTRIWLEEPEPDNEFATRAAWCHGYDVFGALVGTVSLSDYLFLLFRGELPPPAQSRTLQALAVALANPGPRDPAVHAAMCGGVGGSVAASCLTAALAVGAGRHGGAREVSDAMHLWMQCGTDLDAWKRCLPGAGQHDDGAWPAPGHAPGFDPYRSTAATVEQQLLGHLAGLGAGQSLPWLAEHRLQLEAIAAGGLAITGVAAAACVDLGFSAVEAEMLHLLLRLPGAAVHALEQKAMGYKKFPFFDIELLDPPSENKACTPPTR